jgi:hypothetical protein
VFEVGGSVAWTPYVSTLRILERRAHAAHKNDIGEVAPAANTDSASSKLIFSLDFDEPMEGFRESIYVGRVECMHLQNR